MLLTPAPPPAPRTAKPSASNYACGRKCRCDCIGRSFSSARRPDTVPLRVLYLGSRHRNRWGPFFKELMAEELKAGGKGWKTRKRQQRALEKLSIVLARENGAMIARATSWQQAVATRPLARTTNRETE